jgi:2',3'-cyclic-nucleotide 2'-phosphodiesterase (5'-nucleotidase family)
MSRFVPAMVLLLLALYVAAAGSAPGEIATATARQTETGFGNLVADAIRAAARTEVAWIAGGEIREATLKTGGPPTAAAATILNDPADPLVVLPLRGQTIVDALELSLQQYPKPGKAFLHVSGIRVAFTPPLAGGRRRVLVVTPVEPLAVERVYRVAMTRTVALGSFGFFRLWPEGKDVRPENLSVGDALQRLPPGRTLQVAGDGRMMERGLEGER